MKIKDEIRKKIIHDRVVNNYTYAALAAKYGISGTSVGRIVNPEYQEREREKNKLRQRNYKQEKPKYSVNLRFYDGEDELITKVKSEDNIQSYIKGLIRNDVEKNS